MHRSKRKLLVTLSFVLFLSSVSSAAMCQNRIEISRKGQVQYQFLFSVTPGYGYYYPDESSFEVSIPRQATNITVLDGEGDELRYQMAQSKYLNKRLTFYNDESVRQNQEYTFNISYIVPRGVILYGNEAYLSQIVPFSSCQDQATTEVIFPSAWSVNESSISFQKLDDNKIQLGSFNTSLELWFTTEDIITEVKTYRRGIFNVSVPARYSEYVLSQVSNLTDMLPTIERLMGIETPDSFHLKYLPLHSENISEEAAGQYYNGRIEIKSTQLTNQQVFGMETLVHEVVHGYNDKIAPESPDWWWEEGTANYISHQVLEEHGYNISIFVPSRDRINNTFSKCSISRSFISGWSPVEERSGTFSYTLDTCFSAFGDNYFEDKDALGYAYSEILVSDILNGTSAGIDDIYNLMQRKNVTFSETRNKMNNQINYFASKALDKNLTTFLREKGVNAVSWHGPAETLDRIMSKLEEINSSYQYKFFSDLWNQLREARRMFYSGDFTLNKRLSSLLDAIQQRNETISEIMNEYRSTKRYINSLETKNAPKFFETELQNLNQTISYLKSQKYQEARQNIQSARKSAKEKLRGIKSYQHEIENLSSKIQSAPVFLLPFFNGAKSDMQKSRQSFAAGNLEKAMRLLEQSKRKVSRSWIWAILFSVATLSILFFGYRRWETSLK